MHEYMLGYLSDRQPAVAMRLVVRKVIARYRRLCKFAAIDHACSLISPFQCSASAIRARSPLRQPRSNP